MRRRLLLVILGTVALALAFASLVSFFGIRSSASRRAQDNLVQYAQGMVRGNAATDVAILESLRGALGLESAAVWEFEDPAFFPESESSKIGLLPALPVMLPDGSVAQAGGTPERVKQQIGPDALAQLAKRQPVSGTVGDRVYGAVTVKSDPDAVHVLLLVTNVAGEARQAVRTIAIAGAAALLLAAILAFTTARRITRPLSAATDAYRRIATGDLTVRVAGSEGTQRRNDEIGELMRSLDVMAEALDRAQTQEQQFLLSVSHDLRTPLTSIRGFAEAISEGTAPDQQRAGTVIASEARRLERLVGDLLELGKLQAKQFVLSPRTVDLTDLVTDAADGFLPSAERLGLELDLEADEGLVANVDPDRVAQMLANLIENALKFASKRVVVGVRAEDTASIRISVRDDGPGIAPEDVPYVFERHYTSDRRSTRVIGSGLGLAIVRELSDAMNALVTIDTSPAGTTFILRFPVG